MFVVATVKYWTPDAKRHAVFPGSHYVLEVIEGLEPVPLLGSSEQRTNDSLYSFGSMSLDMVPVPGNDSSPANFLLARLLVQSLRDLLPRQ